MSYSDSTVSTPVQSVPIRRTTTASVVLVGLIAAYVSYAHMHAVALTYGEDQITAAVVPLSVDGLIVAASMTMLSDSRSGRNRNWLSYALLLLGCSASLTANILHAHPDIVARSIAAWPAVALIGSYELLMRQIRDAVPDQPVVPVPQSAPEPEPVPVVEAPARPAQVRPIKATKIQPGRRRQAASTAAARTAAFDLIQDHHERGTMITGAMLSEQLHISTGYARRLIREWRDTPRAA